MKTAKWNDPDRTSLLCDRTPVLEGRTEGRVGGESGAVGAAVSGRSVGEMVWSGWCLPSGQGITEFALQSGFLAPGWMLPRGWSKAQAGEVRQGEVPEGTVDAERAGGRHANRCHTRELRRECQ